MRRTLSLQSGRGHLFHRGLAIALALAAQGAAAQVATLVRGDEPWLDGPAAAAPMDAVPTTQGSVRILAIHPPEDTALRPGARVRITVEVAYTQPGRSATLALSLQEPSPAHRPLGAAVVTVQDRAGRATLSAEVQVPDAPALNVYVPLYTREGVATAVVDTRSYRVQRQP